MVGEIGPISFFPKKKCAPNSQQVSQHRKYGSEFQYILNKVPALCISTALMSRHPSHIGHVKRIGKSFSRLLGML